VLVAKHATYVPYHKPFDHPPVSHIKQATFLSLNTGQDPVPGSSNAPLVKGGSGKGVPPSPSVKNSSATENRLTYEDVPGHGCIHLRGGLKVGGLHRTREFVISRDVGTADLPAVARMINMLRRIGKFMKQVNRPTPHKAA
jgi:hypothetical protein